ncbi:ATP-dependent nuclease [Methanobrevibacter sp. UBA337]|jgi:putative ATP-dependent endonuclease of OLD family|uniref:ATP-dependent nuclease n=1 Tax=Methanobrevibacter sp. UBA337 TaxID=1915480 RepID=UPI0039B87045
MYLKYLTIKNFRAIKETTLNFNKGVNVLIGANNSGKTAVIDALRLSLGYKDQKKIHVFKDDFYINKSDSSDEIKDIEFHLSFEITDNDFERGLFLELYNVDENSLDLYFQYTLKEDFRGFERVYSNVWGGKKNGNNVPKELLYLFYHVYLGALRDAHRFLEPGNYNKLGKLFSSINSESINEKYIKDDMIQQIKTDISKSELSNFIEDVQRDYILNHLNKITFENNDLNLNINPFYTDFDSFVNDFKIMLPIFSEESDDNRFFDLSQNGLGYNNLIYISVILSDLFNLRKINNRLFIGLCIEEPEAHIQPQLQNLLFSYLSEDLNRNLNDNKQSFQIFITSHSPTLTAKADLESIILLQSTENNIVNESLKNLIIEDEDKTYLHKFLDVTKSQLFFTKKIIFVEGISEALLIPIFAKLMNIDLEKSAVEIINAQGLTFKHFVPLFDKNSKLSFNGVIITDKDNKKIGEEPSNQFEKINEYINKGFNLKVFSANITFEYELLNVNDENSLIWKIFKDTHPKIMKQNSSANLNKSEKIIKILRHKINKSKISWELSHKLEEQIKDNTVQFEIPKYIKDAINYIMK